MGKDSKHWSEISIKHNGKAHTNEDCAKILEKHVGGVGWQRISGFEETQTGRFRIYESETGTKVAVMEEYFGIERKNIRLIPKE